MRGCICHLVKWQIHPFISKAAICSQRDQYVKIVNVKIILACIHQRHWRSLLTGGEQLELTARDEHNQNRPQRFLNAGTALEMLAQHWYNPGTTSSVGLVQLTRHSVLGHYDLQSMMPQRGWGVKQSPEAPKCTPGRPLRGFCLIAPH